VVMRPALQGVHWVRPVEKVTKVPRVHDGDVCVPGRGPVHDVDALVDEPLNAVEGRSVHRKEEALSCCVLQPKQVAPTCAHWLAHQLAATDADVDASDGTARGHDASAPAV